MCISFVTPSIVGPNFFWLEVLHSQTYTARLSLYLLLCDGTSRAAFPLIQGKS